MTEKYEIVAVETNSKINCGFTVKIEYARDIFTEGLPFEEDAMLQAIDDAYVWYPLLDDIMDFEHGECVGYLYVNSDGEYIETKML